MNAMCVQDGLIVPIESDSRGITTPLSSRITLYRKKKSLTMSQLAHEVGVSESYISFLESGARSPSRKLIKKLVAYFYPQGNPDLLDEWLILAGFAPVNTMKAEAKDTADIASDPVSEQPDNLRFHFARIRDFIRKGDLTRAKEHIQSCLGHFHDSMEIQSLIGTLELAKGNYDQAIRAQELAIEMYADTESRTLGLNDLYLSLGVSHFFKGLSIAE